jgi:hypothetical protein
MSVRAGVVGQRVARHDGADRNFFLLYVALIWVGILSGFGPQVVHHLESHAPPYHPIVHVHALFFVGWLLLLTTQVLLIRSGRLGLHRNLGVAGALLATVMMILGPATAVVTDRLRMTHPGGGDPAFLIVQMTDIVAFTGLVVPALLWRKDPSVHKRLILLATLYITDAGFARWQGGTMEALLGNGFWGLAAQLYFGSDLLMLGIGLYDWTTRRRLYGAYVAGISWVAALELTALLVYLDPRWSPLALRLLSH